jgi:hypothetical protein
MPRPTDLSPRARALAALVLVALVVLGAAAATPWDVRMPAGLLDPAPNVLPSLEPVPTASVTEEPPEAAAADATDVAVMLLVILLGAIAVILALFGRRLVALLNGREPLPQPDRLEAGVGIGDAPPAVTVDELQDAVTVALGRLDRAGTPHDAVVAAWVSLEEAAAAHGTARDPAQTPTEFTSALLADAPVPSDDVATLRRLYHHARFTDRPVDVTHVTAARTALEHIARALDEAGPAPARPAR